MLQMEEPLSIQTHDGDQFILPVHDVDIALQLDVL